MSFLVSSLSNMQLILICTWERKQPTEYVKEKKNQKNTYFPRQLPIQHFFLEEM